MNDEKRKVNFGYIAMIVMSLIMGSALGEILINLGYTGSGGLGSFLVNMALIILFIVITARLQTIIHEAGHLFFGVNSGYRFVSFRIGNHVFLRENGKIVHKKMPMNGSGTGGQCLLGPPEYSEKMPFVLYHMGGVIMNIISSGVFGILFMLFRNIRILGPFLLLASLMGIAFALLNGIPMTTTMVSNDGKNTIDCAHSEKAKKAMWQQLKIVEQSAQGLTLDQMDESLFETDSKSNDILTNTIRYLDSSRHMIQGKYDQALQEMKNLADGYTISNQQRMLLYVDVLYMELIGRNDPQEVDHYHKLCEPIFKSMKSFPSVLRTKYAYEIIHNHDQLRADAIMKEFRKVKAEYPYPHELEIEENFMKIVKK